MYRNIITFNITNIICFYNFFLDNPLYFAYQQEVRLFLHQNGMVTFDSPIANISLPTCTARSETKNRIIALFWAEHHIGENKGNVYYRHAIIIQ